MINISISVDHEALAKLISFINGCAPSAPSVQSEAAKQTRGRKPKENPANETVAVAPEQFVTKPAQTTPAPAPVAATIPTDKAVQDALVAVNDKFGIDKAIECLNKFSVKRGRELRDDQKQAFVDLCKSVLG